MNGGALLYALIAGAAIMAGAAIVTLRRAWSERGLRLLVALSAGFLVSVAFIGLLPEAIERQGASAAVIALFGYLLVHLMQPMLGRHAHGPADVHRVGQFAGIAALAGLIVHTFADGVAIASGFHVSAQLGLLVFVAVLLHKLPEGVAVASLFVAAGASKLQALVAASVLALATVAGALLTDRVLVLAEHGLALSAGVALYVGASTLVPELQHERGWRLPFAFAGGCALFLLAHAFFGA